MKSTLFNFVTIIPKIFHSRDYFRLDQPDKTFYFSTGILREDLRKSSFFFSGSFSHVLRSLSATRQSSTGSDRAGIQSTLGHVAEQVYGQP